MKIFSKNLLSFGKSSKEEATAFAFPQGDSIIKFFMAAGFLVLAAQLVMIFLSGRHVERQDSPSLTETVSQFTVGEEKPYSFYAEQFDQKNIFVEKHAEIVPVAPVVPSVDQRQEAMDFLKNLKLVGIVLDARPQAIVENLQTQETLFLEQGDRLLDATLDNIQESKVTFKYKGQTLELAQ